MYAFAHIAAFYNEALDTPELAPSLRQDTVEKRYNKYADMSEPENEQQPNWDAQARYDAQWGTHNGYSDLDYQLANREY